MKLVLAVMAGTAFGVFAGSLVLALVAEAPPEKRFQTLIVACLAVLLSLLAFWGIIWPNRFKGVLERARKFVAQMKRLAVDASRRVLAERPWAALSWSRIKPGFRVENAAGAVAGVLLAAFIIAFFNPLWAARFQEFQTLASVVLVFCGGIIAYAVIAGRVHEARREEQTRGDEPDPASRPPFKDALHRLMMRARAEFRAVRERSGSSRSESAPIRESETVEVDPISATPEPVVAGHDAVFDVAGTTNKEGETMTAQPQDFDPYEAVLADLRAQQDLLAQAIELLEKLRRSGSPYSGNEPRYNRMPGRTPAFSSREAG